MPAIPPGYLGFNSPPERSVRQYGVMRPPPARAASAAAFAATHAKIPVLIGQPMVTLCLEARRARISLMVISFPLGTLRMISSTSVGDGITIVPAPQRLVILPSILPTFGKPLLSANFSFHDFFEGIEEVFVG